MRERLEYIDLLRGICIFLVVFGHLLQANTMESSQHPIFSFIYSFHMPLFMFISGYIGYKTYKVTSGNDAIYGMLNKARALLIPYFVWPLIVSNLFLVSKYNFDIWRQFSNLLNSWSPLWFLWYLFFLFLLYTAYLLLLKIFRIDKSVISDSIAFVLFIIFGAGINYLKLDFFIDIDSFMLYGLFFFGGIVVSKYSIITDLILNKNIAFVGTILFLVIVGQYNFSDPGVRNKIIKLVISVSSIIIFYNLSRMFSDDNFIRRKLLQYGKYSLVIYVTHFVMFSVYKDRAIFSNFSNLYIIILISGLSIVVIEACIFIKRLVLYSPYLNLMLYGEKFRKNTSE